MAAGGVEGVKGSFDYRYDVVIGCSHRDAACTTWHLQKCSSKVCSVQWAVCECVQRAGDLGEGAPTSDDERRRLISQVWSCEHEIIGESLPNAARARVEHHGEDPW